MKLPLVVLICGLSMVAVADEHAPLDAFAAELESLTESMMEEARALDMSRRDCLDAASPELGEMLYPGDPDAYLAVVEAFCAEMF